MRRPAVDQTLWGAVALLLVRRDLRGCYDPITRRRFWKAMRGSAWVVFAVLAVAFTAPIPPAVGVAASILVGVLVSVCVDRPRVGGATQAS